jgi:HK97 family phage portal protein
MGILDNIALLLGRGQQPFERKEAPVVHISGPTYTSGKKDNFKNFAQEGYKENAIVYRCVNEVANGAAAIPFCVYQGDIKLDSHPLISLLERPNPLQAGVEYFQSLYSYLLLSGNSYALQQTANGIPSELHILRPDRIEIEPSSTAIPKAYKYKIGQEVIRTYPADPKTGGAEVKHFKFWNPLDDYLGLSPLSAASISIDQNNMVSKHNIALLANGARPSGAIVFKPSDDAGNRTMLTDGQRDQLQSDLANRFKGVNNAGRPMLLEGDFEWKEMGMSPKDMDFLAQANMTAKDIALCFGVPSQLIGIPDAQTYANVQEARLALYEETIIPLARRVESDLNEWLVPAFGDDITVKYDIDAIPAMTERRRRIYENVTSAVRDGIISRNEARERLGLEPISGGDEVFIAANLFPLGGPEVAEDEGQDAEDAGKEAYGDFESKSKVGTDTYTTRTEAAERAEEIGCVGTHQHTVDGEVVFMPCDSHASYQDAKSSEVETTKAESDVDTKPTEAMARNAQRSLDLRKEYGRGMTRVGVARANQLIDRERLSPDTVRRMKSFFARHEVDKQAQGFRRGEDGWPSNGLIAWLGWGGDEGQAWANRKTKALDKERDKGIDFELHPMAHLESEQKAPISAAVKKGLAEKVKDHNDEYGDKKGKRVSQGMLEAVFRRGVGAYNTNPSSVRPTVSSADQWAYARVNSFLFAVRRGRFKGGKFDTDLLPEGHPLRTKDKAIAAE